MLDGPSSVLVIGASGQIAQALARGARDHPFAVLCAGRGLADISVPAQIEALFREQAPAVVINAAAYTAVDRAESDEASAFAVNAEGQGTSPGSAARSTRRSFTSRRTMYSAARGASPTKKPIPRLRRGVYGASKAAGEEAVRSIWPRHLILRTAWIYSNDGHNFLKTMLRLGAERSELAVVNDQIGSPARAQDVADAILRIVPRLLSRDDGIAWGTYHLTNEGEASWFDFASEIFRIARMAGGPSPSLRPIVTAEYPTPARRPAYSVLDTSRFRGTFGFGLPHWQVSLAQCLALGLGAGRAREAHR